MAPSQTLSLVEATACWLRPVDSHVASQSDERPGALRVNRARIFDIETGKEMLGRPPRKRRRSRRDPMAPRHGHPELTDVEAKRGRRPTGQRVSHELVDRFEAVSYPVDHRAPTVAFVRMFGPIVLDSGEWPFKATFGIRALANTAEFGIERGIELDARLFSEAMRHEQLRDVAPTVAPKTLVIMADGLAEVASIVGGRQLYSKEAFVGSLTCAPDPTDLPEAFALWRAHVRYASDYAESTVEKMYRDCAAVEEELAAVGVTLPTQLTPDLVAAAIARPSHRGGQLGQRTIHYRLKSLRSVSVIWTFLRIDHDNSVRSMRMPVGMPARERSLTDDEVALVRAAVMRRQMPTVLIVMVALALAGATTYEIACVRRRDVDLTERTVWLRGSGRSVARTVRLDPWSAARLGFTFQSRQLDPDDLVASSLQRPETPTAGSRRVAGRLQTLLKEHGLYRPSEVNCNSLRYWAGRKKFEETGSIEEAARLLGCRSLETAAEQIGWDWREGVLR
ncbi:MAG: site-specific integrase [Acidimicrobiales bacterium]